MSNTAANVIASLETAITLVEYDRAKRRAARLCRADQLTVVDAFIAARRRIEAQFTRACA